VAFLDRLRERIRSRVAVVAPTAARRRTTQHVEPSTKEGRLRARLEEDPNDRAAFAEVAEIVRANAAEGHEGEQRPRAMADAEWALAEELAHSPRAWYPLIELARLSVDDDLDGAMRRLATAVEREPTGEALAESLAMLRRQGKLDAALSLGVGHWRPKQHVPAAGRELVLAAVEAGRLADARRHLDVLAQNSDTDAVTDLRIDLDARLAGRKPSSA
jgi:hypothetical protein